MNKNLLLENRSYRFFKKIAFLLPVKMRTALKNTSLHFTILDLIKWKLIDLQRPRFFHPAGLFFYCGNVGTGKTIFMTRELDKLRKKYKDSILIGTNYFYKYQDFEVNGFDDIIKMYDKPCVIGYDEIQNDFDSRDWANLDSGFSERITQSRKMNGMMILATAQKFGFVDKRLRQLTFTIHQCKTWFGRFTWALVYRPEEMENIENGLYTDFAKKKKIGMKYFVQSDYVRELYNSFQILASARKRMKKLDKEEQIFVKGIRKLSRL